MRTIETIAAAVTPAVIISAGAVLMQGIWAEHRVLADRIREGTRALCGDPSPERRENIQAQLCVFRRRIRWATAALIATCGSVATFLLVVLAIGALGMRPEHQFEGSLLVQMERALFVLGVTLLLTGITCVLFDVRLATHTLDLELDHALGASVPAPRSGTNHRGRTTTS